jgi:hypothetical protein
MIQYKNINSLLSTVPPYNKLSPASTYVSLRCSEYYEQHSTREAANPTDMKMSGSTIQSTIDKHLMR